MPGTFSTLFRASLQFVHGWLTGSISPCGTTARIRLFSSRSKPFMALRPTISTATPSAIPMVEITEISDTMPPRRRPRLKRKPMSNDNGDAITLLPSGSVPRSDGRRASQAGAPCVLPAADRGSPPETRCPARRSARPEAGKYCPRCARPGYR